MTPLAVTSVGVVTPAGVGWEAFTTALRAAAAPDATRTLGATPTTFDAANYPGARVAEVLGFDASRFLGDKGLRNTDRLTRLFLVATRLALEGAGLKRAGAFAALGADDVGVCAATAYGSLEAITELDRVARLEDPRYLNPARFPNTVINSALGYVSIWEDLRALNVTITNGVCGALDAVFCAATFVGAGRARAVAVGGAEAMSEALFLAFDKLGALSPVDRACAPGDPGSAGLCLGEGAAIAVLETPANAARRGALVRAIATGYGTAFEPPTREGSLLEPSSDALARAIAGALADAGVAAAEVDLVASGLSGHPWLDRVELAGIDAALGRAVPVAAPKALLGDTLGGAGALALASAVAWLEGTPVGTLVRGPAPARVQTVVVPSLGFYGNASALVVRSDRGTQA